MTDDPVIKVRSEKGKFIVLEHEIHSYLGKIGSHGYVVYSILQRYSNHETGRCYPKIGTIAGMMGVSRGTVHAALGSLIDVGLLSMTSGATSGKANEYILLRIGCQPADRGCQPAEGGVSPLTPNKEELELSNKNQKPCPPSSGGDNGNGKTDPRYPTFLEVISAGYKHRGWEFAWNGKDGKQLKALLKERPAWTVEQFRKCLTNYFASEKVVPGDQPYRYLASLPRYHAGPLNEFGKLIRTETQSADPIESPTLVTKRQIADYNRQKGYA